MKSLDYLGSTGVWFETAPKETFQRTLELFFRSACAITLSWRAGTLSTSFTRTLHELQSLMICWLGSPLPLATGVWSPLSYRSLHVFGYLREAFWSSVGIRFQRVYATEKCIILDVPEVQPLCVDGKGAPPPPSKNNLPSIGSALIEKRGSPRSGALRRRSPGRLPFLPGRRLRSPPSALSGESPGLPLKRNWRNQTTGQIPPGSKHSCLTLPPGFAIGYEWVLHNQRTRACLGSLLFCYQFLIEWLNFSYFRKMGLIYCSTSPHNLCARYYSIWTLRCFTKAMWISGKCVWFWENYYDCYEN